MISEVKITPVLDFCVQKHFILSCLTIYLKIRNPPAPDGLKTFALKYWKIGNYFPFFSFPILHKVRSSPLNLKMSAVWRHRHFSSTNSESEGFNLKHDGCKSAFRQMASASRTPYLDLPAVGAQTAQSVNPWPAAHVAPFRQKSVFWIVHPATGSLWSLTCFSPRTDFKSNNFIYFMLLKTCILIHVILIKREK